MVQGRGKGPETLTGDAIRGSQNSDLRLVSSDRQRRLLGHVYLLLKLHRPTQSACTLFLRDLRFRNQVRHMAQGSARPRRSKRCKVYSRENTVVSGWKKRIVTCWRNVSDHGSAHLTQSGGAGREFLALDAEIPDHQRRQGRQTACSYETK
jgi:hypothetical protein